MQNTSVLLVAAGKSSRMGCFKPMMRLDGKPLIDHAISAFYHADIKETVVVSGFRSQELESHFKDTKIKLLNNTRYKETEMIDSIQLGLLYLQNTCDRVFIMPADMPLIQPFTIEVLSGYSTDKPLVQPSFHGKHGHPILVSADCIPSILQFHGDGGLRNALKSFEKEIIEIPDPGILSDADTPEAFARIQSDYDTQRIPSRELALAMLKWYANDARIIGHCLAVADTAQEVAQHAIKRGWPFKLQLIEAAALLHDIARKSRRNHAQKAFDLLCKLGYPEVGRVIASHMDLPRDAVAHPDERAVVYLADKLVLNDKCVGLKNHFAITSQKYKNDANAAAAIQRRLDDAVSIMKKLGLSEDK